LSSLSPESKPPRVPATADDDLGSLRVALSKLYAKTWGKPWDLVRNTVSKAEIVGDKPVSADSDAYDLLCGLLNVPDEFSYGFSRGMQDIQWALGGGVGMVDILVIREEYQSLIEELGSRDRTGHTKGVAVIGQPGIGSCQCCF